MRIETQFENRGSAELWDEHIRWRSAGVLRDVTVDDTWRRVGEALAAAGGGTEPPLRARAYARSFCRWRLLPDLALLAGAGTDRPGTEGPRARVWLNCAAFVVPQAEGAAVDWRAYAADARLSAWLVDDAIALTRCAWESARVGLLGVGEAFARLGLDYGSPQARRLAVRFATVLTAGAAEGSLQLAVERGVVAPACPEQQERWRRCGLDEEMLAFAAQRGVRHRGLTCVAAAPKLAALAGSSDALRPSARGGSPPPGLDSARAELRDSLQPWLDHGVEADAA